MKKIFGLALLSLLLINTVYPQSSIDVNKYIENPRIFSENKEESAAIIIPHDSHQSAINYDIKKSSYYQSLNSDWKFKWQINPSLVPDNFYETKFNDVEWNDIPVPSNWQMQGYDHQMYRNIPMEFEPYDPPMVTDDINPTGCYRTKFTIPDNWQDRKTILHFDGVQSAAFIWVNGKYVGYHEDGMTHAEFNITEKLNDGENLLAVMVLRWSDGSYLEDQDMFRFSGIYRDVYVFSKPKICLNDLFIKTDLDEKYVDANLILDLSLKNYTSKPEKVFVKYSLFDKDKKLVFENTTDVLEINDKLSTTVEQNVISPLKWSDEKPNLYTLVIELLNEKNESLEIISKRVGFRELEVMNGIALLNGMPVYFRGTNRHEIDPEGGKTLSREMMIKDIKLLKQFNFNSVRTCHYPNDPLWYDLCDEYGILLQDEVNAECHYTENEFPKREDYLDAFMDRFIRMVQRDKNHPSVVMWSTGNECGLDVPHYKMAEYIKQFDPTRFLMHQSNWPDGEAPYVDIIGPRYPTPSRLRQIGLATDKPVVMGEYAHAMGSSLGHFDEFWETIYSIPKLQGGYVWDWVDQGLNVKSRFVKDYSNNDVQCGVMGNPELVDGMNDKAIKLTGLDDWIEIYDDPRLDIRGKYLAIEFSLKPQKFYSESHLVTKAMQFGVIQTTVDTLCFYINGYRNKLKVQVPENWFEKNHDVKAVYDGKAMQLSVDGILLGSKNYDQPIRSSHYPINIGRDSYKDNDQHLGWLANCIFDEVKISDSIKDDEPILWLKFDEITDGANYFTYGISPFCHNGMVTPDRKPQPELWQAKHSMSPVRFYSDNPRSGKFTVVNKFSFTNLNEFDIEWKVLKDGVVENSGTVDLDVEPQSEKEFNIRVPGNYEEFKNYILEFSCKMKNDEPFREKGFEVDFQQFVLSEAKLFKGAMSNNNNEPKIKITEDDESLLIGENEFRYVINKSSGAFSLYKKDEVLIKDLVPNVWRTPISNEKVDWGKAEAEDWYRMGLNKPEITVEEIEYDKEKESIVASVKIKSIITFPGSSDLIINELAYTLKGANEFEIHHDMTPVGYFEMSWMPCMGLAFEVPDKFQNIKWYGHGPFENFNDRCTGSRIGLHSAVIDSIQNPYQEPQEYGNYSGVTRFEIKNEKDEGIAVSSSNPIDFCASQFYNLDRAKFTYQLLQDDFSRVKISYGMTGVGDTPNPVMPQYRVYPKKYSNTISIFCTKSK
ncbi:MAG: glycoside hydrolase family 2 TIM barrel-domain containing protein [bacterium]